MNMKQRIAILAGVLLLLTAAGCSKQKTCRCSVLGTDVVRTVKIEKGECDQLRTYQYHDGLDNIVEESLICTDFEFDIDSIYQND